MPPKNHAILSASSSERWLNCPPSARLCENYEDKGSDYAAEGTDAHALCEYRLKQVLGIPADDPIENLSWYNEEMEECAQGYAAYVVELLETANQTCSDPVVMIEQRVNFTRWVQEGFGTADCILIADGVLNIVDYKHGKGIEVSAVVNPQMMLYALGALEIFDDIYDIDTVRMTIYQPRKSNVSVYEMGKSDLLEWADTELTQKAKLAFEGQGDFRCGEWCRFCKAKAECRERAEANMALARYDFQAPALLDDSEIADILGKVDALTTWASDVKEYALQQAISGKDWSGWKLVEGRSNRKYTNDAVVAATVENAGFDPYERKVLGVTAMQKLLGKSRFEELLAPYIEKPQGNEGEVPQYYVENSHPAIIEPDEWDHVQAELTRRKSLGRAYSGKSIFSAKLVCEECGSFFGSKVWHSTDQYRRTIWQCNGKFTNAERCHTPTLDNETIQRLFIQAYNQLMSDRKQTIADCELTRKCLTDFAALDAEIERQLEETQVIAEMVKAAVKENASTAQSQEAYLKKYEALTERYEKAATELERLQAERTARTQQDKKIALFIRTFKNLPETMTEWDDTIWTVMVEKALVHRNGQITFIFKNGTEIKVGA